MKAITRWLHRGQGKALAAALQSDAITLHILAARVGGLRTSIRSNR